ncbi:MAG: DUF507 family protein [Polyangiaceae bacterium]
MRLFSGIVDQLSEDIVKTLLAAKDIEVEERAEVVRDIVSVFQNYLTIDRQATEKAKDLIQSRSMAQTEFPRLRKLTAEQAGIKVGDDMMDYLLDQLIEILMHSHNVDEVFAEDHGLRRTMRPVLKKHLDVEAELDAEARGKLKHMQEGTRTWEVEYQRIMGDIQRRRGLNR